MDSSAHRLLLLLLLLLVLVLVLLLLLLNGILPEKLVRSQMVNKISAFYANISLII
jgi:hypothetical protein